MVSRDVASIALRTIVNILKKRKKVTSKMSGYSASSSYFLPLISHLKNASNTSEAQVMKKYMKNNFEFYGVRAPQCKDFLKQHIENQGLPQDMSQLSHIVHYAWECPHRELQYIGMYIMDKCQNIWQSGDQLKSLFEFMIKHKSWWDTVDFISSSLVNYWWKMDPELLDKSITPEWNKSDNFWLNRTSIIYQLRRKGLTNERILSQHIIPHSHSNEFFVQKAIGWALREYAKINSKWVLDFVATHQLKPLSKREALKQIKAGKIKRPW